MKTILCYGDSNTWGYMPKTEGPEITADNRYPWGVRWTSRLQMALGHDYRVAENGVNGRTTMFDCPMAEYRNGLKDIDVCIQAQHQDELSHSGRKAELVAISVYFQKSSFRHALYD